MAAFRVGDHVCYASVVAAFGVESALHGVVVRVEAVEGGDGDAPAGRVAVEWESALTQVLPGEALVKVKPRESSCTQ